LKQLGSDPIDLRGGKELRTTMGRIKSWFEIISVFHHRVVLERDSHRGLDPIGQQNRKFRIDCARQIESNLSLF
jgi:hypothetical protein